MVIWSQPKPQGEKQPQNTEHPAEILTDEQREHLNRLNQLGQTALLFL